MRSACARTARFSFCQSVAPAEASSVKDGRMRPAYGSESIPGAGGAPQKPRVLFVLHPRIGAPSLPLDCAQVSRGVFACAYRDSAGIVDQALIIPRGRVPRCRTVAGDRERVILSRANCRDRVAIIRIAWREQHKSRSPHGFIVREQPHGSGGALLHCAANGSAAKLVGDGQRLSAGQNFNARLEGIAAADPNGVEIIPRRGQSGENLVRAWVNILDLEVAFCVRDAGQEGARGFIRRPCGATIEGEYDTRRPISSSLPRPVL